MTISDDQDTRGSLCEAKLHLLATALKCMVARTPLIQKWFENEAKVCLLATVALKCMVACPSEMVWKSFTL